MGRQQQGQPRREAEREFDEIFSAYYDIILHYIWRSVGNQSDGEELAQKTFLTLYTKLLVQPIEHPKPWLFQVATYNIGHYRRALARRSKHEVPIDDVFEDMEELAAPPRPSEREDFLAGLPVWLKPSDRELLALYYFDGFTLREVAARSGYTYGGLRVHLSGLTGKLRQRGVEI